MSEDILERAKKADIDLMAITDWGQLRDLFGELIAEIERLRSLNESLMENGNDLRTRCQKAETRIKELEAEAQEYHDKKEEALTLCAGQNRYIERLEAEFLESEAYAHACMGESMPVNEEDLQAARDELERIKAETGSGDHVAGANKLILTAEQREALEHVIEYVQETPISNLNEFDMQELRSLLTGSKPAWVWKRGY